MSKVQHRSPWDIDIMDDLFDDCAAAKGSSASLTDKISAMDAAIAGKQDALTFDDAPTSGSSNPVKSSGIYTALSGKASAADQTADRAALVELVDSGSKNLSNWYTGTAATDGTTIATAVPISYRSGDFVFSYTTSLTTGSITIGFRDENNTLVGSVQVDNITKVKTATIPSDAVRFNVYASKAGTYSNFMICSKAAWDISHAFQPYRPSYQELCDRVAALDDRVTALENA